MSRLPSVTMSVSKAPDGYVVTTMDKALFRPDVGIWLQKAGLLYWCFFVKPVPNLLGETQYRVMYKDDAGIRKEELVKPSERVYVYFEAPKEKE